MKLWLLTLLIPIAAIAQQYKSPQDSLGIVAGQATDDRVKVHFASTGVRATTFQQILTTADRNTGFEAVNTTPNLLSIGVGTSSSEVIISYIFPGGISTGSNLNIQRVYRELPPGSYISVQAGSLGENITSGSLFLQFFGIP